MSSKCLKKLDIGVVNINQRSIMFWHSLDLRLAIFVEEVTIERCPNRDVRKMASIEM